MTGKKIADAANASRFRVVGQNTDNTDIPAEQLREMCHHD
jgi:hypothetical protein